MYIWENLVELLFNSSGSLKFGVSAGKIWLNCYLIILFSLKFGVSAGKIWLNCYLYSSVQSEFWCISWEDLVELLSNYSVESGNVGAGES